MTDAIRIFTTGGTIDKVYFDEKSEFEIGAPLIGDMLQSAEVRVPYAVEALMRKDSLDLTDEDRALIRARVDPALEIGPHRLDLRLLEHHLAQPDTGRIGRLAGRVAPWQITPVGVVPGQQARA